MNVKFEFLEKKSYLMRLLLWLESISDTRRPGLVDYDHEQLQKAIERYLEVSSDGMLIGSSAIASQLFFHDIDYDNYLDIDLQSPEDFVKFGDRLADICKIISDDAKKCPKLPPIFMGLKAGRHPCFRYNLMWTIDEVLDRRKFLWCSRRYVRLPDALMDSTKERSHIKYDVYAPIGETYIELTTVLKIKSIEACVTPAKRHIDDVQGLVQKVTTFLNEGKAVKACKRALTLQKLQGTSHVSEHVKQCLVTLPTLFSGRAAALGQAASRIETMLEMLGSSNRKAVSVVATRADYMLCEILKAASDHVSDGELAARVHEFMNCEKERQLDMCSDIVFGIGWRCFGINWQRRRRWPELKHLLKSFQCASHDACLQFLKLHSIDLESVAEELGKTEKQTQVPQPHVYGKEAKSRSDFILACKEDGISHLIKYATEEQKKDVEVLLAAFLHEGITFTPEQIQEEREVVRRAVRCKRLLECVSEEMRGDRDIVLAAVQQDGKALEWASDERKKDKDILLVAFQQMGMKFTPEEMKGESEIALAAVRQDWTAHKFGSKKVQGDETIKAIVRKVMERDGGQLREASKEMKGDRDIVMVAVRQDWTLHKFGTKEVQKDEGIKELVRAAVQKDGRALEHASEEMKGDREIVMAAVQQNWMAHKFCSKELQKDAAIKALVRRAMERDGKGLRVASEEMKGDRDIVRAAVGQDGRALEYAAQGMKGEREIVMAAVQQDWRALEWASEEMKGDRDVVMAAVRQGGKALKWASKEMKGDRDVVMAAVQQDGTALEWASEGMRQDWEIVEVATGVEAGALEGASEEKLRNIVAMLTGKTRLFTQKDGRALEKASEEMKGDRDIVKVAVGKNGRALEHASEEMKGDREIVMAAVQQNWMAHKFCSKELQKDAAIKALVRTAMEYNGTWLASASEEMRGDRDIVMAAVGQDWRALQYAAQELQGDAWFQTLARVRQRGLALAHVAEKMKGDRRIVMAAVQQDGRALEWASEEMKGDRDIVKVAVGKDGRALEHTSEEMKEDRDVVMAAVQQDWRALEWASEEMKGDRDIVKVAVGKNGRALEHASEEMKGDREIVMAAVQQAGGGLEWVQQNWMAHKFCSKELQKDAAIKALVRRAMERDGKGLRVASEEMKGDRDVVMAAVENYWEAHKYASKEMQKDQTIKALVRTAMEYNGTRLASASEEMRGDRDIVMAAVRQDWRALQYAAQELQGDAWFQTLARVRQDGLALAHVAQKMKGDRRIVMAAVQQDGRSLQFASDELKNDQQVLLASFKQLGLNDRRSRIDFRLSLSPQ